MQHRICGFRCNAYVLVVQLLQAMQCHITECARVCVYMSMATIRGSWVQCPRPIVLLLDVVAPARLAWLSSLVIPICITHSIPIDHEHLLSHDAVNYGRPLSICLAD